MKKFIFLVAVFDLDLDIPLFAAPSVNKQDLTMKKGIVFVCVCVCVCVCVYEPIGQTPEVYVEVF